MNLSLTITRTGLSLPDLVITNNPFGAKFWLPEEGLEEPDAEYRIGYMPDHPDVHGREKISAALEQATLPAVIYTQAADAAGLRANKAELRAALGQWAFTVTLDQDGAADSYSADPCTPRWGAIESGMLAQRMARASVVIPVYPIPVGV